jgi:hypothetical protein
MSTREQLLDLIRDLGSLRFTEGTLSTQRVDAGTLELLIDSQASKWVEIEQTLERIVSDRVDSNGDHQRQSSCSDDNSNFTRSL